MLEDPGKRQPHPYLAQVVPIDADFVHPQVALLGGVHWCCGVLGCVAKKPEACLKSW